METANDFIDVNHGVDLTGRELEVLHLLVKGFPNRQIAAELHIGAACVRFHLKEIYSRTGISTRTGLVAWAIQRMASDS